MKNWRLLRGTDWGNTRLRRYYGENNFRLKMYYSPPCAIERFEDSDNTNLWKQLVRESSAFNLWVRLARLLVSPMNVNICRTKDIYIMMARYAETLLTQSIMGQPYTRMTPYLLCIGADIVKEDRLPGYTPMLAATRSESDKHIVPLLAAGAVPRISDKVTGFESIEKYIAQFLN